MENLTNVFSIILVFILIAMFVTLISLWLYFGLKGRKKSRNKLATRICPHCKREAKEIGQKQQEKAGAGEDPITRLLRTRMVTTTTFYCKRCQIMWGEVNNFGFTVEDVTDSPQEKTDKT